MQNSDNLKADLLRQISQLRNRVEQLEVTVEAENQAKDQRTAELAEVNERLRVEIEERRQVAEQLQAVYDGMVDGLLIARVATRRFVGANSSINRRATFRIGSPKTARWDWICCGDPWPRHGG